MHFGCPRKSLEINLNPKKTFINITFQIALSNTHIHKTLYKQTAKSNKSQIAFNYRHTCSSNTHTSYTLN